MQKKIEYLRIVLTGQCNLNCSYCHNEGMEKINNSIIEIDKIVMITTALYKCGIRKFKLMGGEPTLYKNLPELINELKKIGNDIDISMITNGLFEKELIAKSISSGLGRVNVSVHSWGNDWDNHQTNHITVNTKEEAKVWYDMMQLCKDRCNQSEGVTMLGNSVSFDNSQMKMICNFIREHYHMLNLYYYKKYQEEPDFLEDDIDDDLLDMFSDLSGELLGKSDKVICRVMEECIVTYSEIDVSPEIIIFDTI